MLLLLFLMLGCARADPPLLSYPGQVNIGLLADMRTGDECDALKERAAPRALSAVWAAAQENFAHPQQLNIGVYIFDTCGRTDVAERQAYRMLGHVLPEKRTASTAPIFAVVTDGSAADFTAAPGRLLDVFHVPVVAATDPPQDTPLIRTATDTTALAQAAVTVLQRLHLLEVAVMAEEGGGVFGEFTRQAARVAGLRVEGMEEGEGMEVKDTFAALRHIPRKSPLKAVVFLVSVQEAERLLSEADEIEDSRLWLIVTPTEIRSPPLHNKSRKVLLLSPESSDFPDFDAYFQQLLEEDTARYHPLLQEHLATLNGTAEGHTDVSSVVRAVRLISSALRLAQGQLCGRTPSECLRQRALGELTGKVSEALRKGALRYVLREMKDGGDVTEVGSYSEDSGLQLYDDLLGHLNKGSPPSSDLRWRIFDDDALFLNVFDEKAAVTTSTAKSVPEDFHLLQNDFRLQSLDNVSSALPATNLRSVSLTSHHETHETRSEEGGAPSIDSPPIRRQPMSLWLGSRPWAWAILGTSALLSLAALYALVYQLVKSCENGGGARNILLPALHTASLLSLCLGAGLHAWKPSSLLCALRGVVTNSSLVFCYGVLLLRGMHLRAQASLGLGGRVSRFNQLLSLALAVGVQVALETSYWPQECSAPKWDILQSRIYAGVLVVVATGVAAVANRRGGLSVPSGRRDGRGLLCSTLGCVLLLGAWYAALWLLPGAGAPRDIACAALLLSTAACALMGLLWVGAQPRKRPLSYADSLSTVFTLFSKEDAGSRTSTTGRGRTKTLEKSVPSCGENLLYSEYQSAYP
ncbi:hypothetical protein JTE90_020223 [Oedothorax gibbosus]|uniref:Receptor ligand binding region domain-containing protein n=1 Tax=Oedothorax gibbosus TaxID=931172 RepID=A0AAV6UYV9_9ARAC|nr:hypothetical protein JTE90_020223 [Oedothorax gibbosus]